MGSRLINDLIFLKYYFFKKMKTNLINLKLFNLNNIKIYYLFITKFNYFLKNKWTMINGNQITYHKMKHTPSYFLKST